MRRRTLLASSLCVAIAGRNRLALAQANRRARLGWLSGGSRTSPRPLDILTQTLHELGWKLGETLDIDERLAEGDASRLPPLAAEIVALRPDVIACTGRTEATALQAATRAIPIVFMQVAGDPAAAGLVESISRPGGNVTGCLQAPQLLSGKRFELLAELLGRRPRRLVYILNPGNISSLQMWTDAVEAAEKIGADILRVDVETPTDIENAFARLSNRDAVLVQFDFLLVALSRQTADLAVRYRFPVMYESRLQMIGGGLMSYGADLGDNYRQGARYVDRILKGAHPRDLPVVQGSRFELVLNTSAAKAIGLNVSPSLLALADEVIE